MTTTIGAPLGVMASGYRVPPPLTPDQVAGLVSWYDADDASTFTFSTGNSVSQWNDKSPNGYHATWINSGWPATRVPAGINGRAAMDFHPASMDTMVPGDLKPITVIAAVKTGATTANTVLLGGRFTGVSSEGSFGIDTYNGKFRAVGLNVAVIGQATVPFTANTPTVLSTSYGADNVWALHLNGAAAGTGATAVTFPDKKLGLGGGGGASPNQSLYDGLIGEMVIYNRVLTGSERNGLHAYLKTKWGVI